MKNIISPAALKVLLHIYTIPDKYKYSTLDYYGEATLEFFDCGVIEHCDLSEHKWKVTPLGEAWVKTILSTPMPKMAYVDVNNKVISGLI